MRYGREIENRREREREERERINRGSLL